MLGSLVRLREYSKSGHRYLGRGMTYQRGRAAEHRLRHSTAPVGLCSIRVIQGDVAKTRYANTIHMIEKAVGQPGLSRFMERIALHRLLLLETPLGTRHSKECAQVRREWQRLAEESTITPSGKIIDRYEFLYDGDDRLIESRGYDPQGRVEVRRVWGYEGNQRGPSTFAYYGRNGKVYERTRYAEYEVNARGDWVSRKEFTEETLNRKTIAMVYRKIETTRAILL